MIRSFLTIIVVLVIGGAVYYFYNYHNRTISSDINTAKEYAGDSATTSAVKTALALNKQLASFDVHVETTDKTVTLTGSVPAAADKRVAGEVALSTNGVASVMNNLQVDPSLTPGTQAGDTGTQASEDTRSAVLQAMLKNPLLKTTHIKVDVNNGDVKLSGAVHTQAQKSSAESSAGAVAGVHNVDSRALIVTN